MGHSFHQPPFPALHWDGYCWQGHFALPAWAGFRVRHGALEHPEEEDTAPGGTAAGLVKLRISILGDQPQSPSREQITAFEHLSAAQSPLRDAILEAIARLYPDWQESYGYDEIEQRAFMPHLEHPQDLSALMELSVLHILTTSCEGLAYIGFEFNCTWDDEHGLGALTHGGRVVEVGAADTAFLEWMAERDCRPKGME